MNKETRAKIADMDTWTKELDGIIELIARYSNLQMDNPFYVLPEDICDRIRDRRQI